MSKRFGLVLLLILLSGCSLGRRESTVAPALYDLGAVPYTEKVPGFSRTALDVRMPFWVGSSSGIQYRLLYNDPLRLYEYATARWAGMPSGLIQQRLRQQLRLPSGQGGSVSPCLLSLDIAEFGHVFSRPDTSYGVLRGEARLLGPGQKMLAARSFKIQRPASTQDVRGGVAALSLAADGLAAELSEWLTHLPKDAPMLACRGE